MMTGSVQSSSSSWHTMVEGGSGDPVRDVQYNMIPSILILTQKK